ncbi:TonB-dependent receptor [Sphingobacterium sp. SGR-19]|nr:TonB-dependent receptor [Sphingobacterium sp. SGR-19]
MLVFLCHAVSAQTVLRGVVTDGKEPIIGASIAIQGTTVGTSTDSNGAFSLNSPVDAGTLVIRFLGFLPAEVNFPGGATDLGTIVMNVDNSQNLGEVVVVGRGVIDIADRKTPIAASTITPLEIQEKGVGNVEFPEIMKNTPSVYVADQAGGFGDSKMYVRGFDQSNTAFLLNGQPINGMEDGNMYWSNWAGMTDIASFIQIQRGLGSSKLAISSVGGTVNIVTKATEMQKGGYVRMTTGNDGYAKATIGYNTGLQGKWGASFMLDGWRGDRKYAVGTAGAGQNYFVSVGFKPNDNHIFNFMILGSPQWHDQNFSKPLVSSYSNNGVLSTPGYDITGVRGNYNYGWFNGEGLSQRTNFYHKPVSNLNWDWKINEKSSLSTVLYASLGKGGGTGVLGNGPGFIDGGYSAENGFTNWDVLAQANAGLPNGLSEGYNGSVLRASVNNHLWYGMVANYNFDTQKYWSFNVGTDLRFYTGDHYQQLVNLLGANGRIENNENRAEGHIVSKTFSANPWSALFNSAKVDERVGYDNAENINYQGLFGQAEFSKDGFSAFIQGSISNQAYQKIDRWNYAEGEAKSDFEKKFGYNLKGGASYTVADNHTFFVNLGKYSRQPYLDNIFVSNSVDLADPAVDNEEIFGLEGGYKFSTSLVNVNINGYYTKWENRFTSYQTRTDEFPGINEVSYLFTGVGQLHKGLELDFDARILPELTLRGYGSIGDWKYDGKSPYRVRDNDSYDIIFEDTEGQDLTGVRVGNAAQTSLGLGAKYYILPHFSVDADFNHYSRLYGNVDIDDVIESSLNNEVYQAEKLDNYNIVDFGLSYTFKLNNGQHIKFRGNIKNLLNEEYFSRKDGYGYFYGLGTTWNAGLTYNF